ncbi:MAG: ABC transporter substrate-binding protein, partial [Actinobacteria bacterium]|nr:ABC transporter substrate-binding protein [Actinomycetota bacterium]
EQIRGDPIDGRADQYALACLLYECLTGEPPYRRPTEVALLFAHLEDEPRATGEPVDAVFARALAKEPAERYPSCVEFVGGVRDALGVAEPRRRRWPLAAGAGLAVGLSAVSLFALTRGDSGAGRETSGRLVRIDPATSIATDTLRIGSDPSSVAAGASGVWVASRGDSSVWRVDPDTNEVELQAPAHGTPADLSVNRAHVLVADGPVEAKLAVIDPETGVQEDLFSLDRGRFFGSSSVAAVETGVWVATGDRRVGRLDVLTGDLIDPLVIPQPPAERAHSIFSGIGVGEGAVWVIGDPHDHTLYRIDAESGELVAKVPLPLAPTDIAAGERGIWITSYLEDKLLRIDPASNDVAATVRVGKGANGVATGAGSVWVANAIEGTVSRVDPSTLRVETIDVEAYPDDVAVAGDAVWVTGSVVGDPVPADAVTVGVLAPCDGTYGALAPVSFGGAELPLLDRGAMLAGRTPADGVKEASVAGADIQLVLGCSDDSAQDALYEARRLIELRGADIVIGTYFAAQSLAIREYLKEHPDISFVNGVDSSQTVTLHDPAPNFFRFMTDAAQWQAGVGQYARNTLGWKRVVTVGDADPFQYTETSGFVAEFCALGGDILRQIWAPLGTVDFTPLIAQVPRRGVDGFFITAQPPTALAFLAGVPQLRGPLSDVVVGTILLTVPPVPERLGERLQGVVLGAPDDTETRSAREFVRKFT